LEGVTIFPVSVGKFKGPDESISSGPLVLMRTISDGRTVGEIIVELPPQILLDGPALGG